MFKYRHTVEISTETETCGARDKARLNLREAAENSPPSAGRQKQFPQ